MFLINVNAIELNSKLAGLTCNVEAQSFPSNKQPFRPGQNLPNPSMMFDGNCNSNDYTVHIVQRS